LHPSIRSLLEEQRIIVERDLTSLQSRANRHMSQRA
jgi:hypothetical protein